MVREMYSDIVDTDGLATKHRIPVINSWYPSFTYFVAVNIPEENVEPLISWDNLLTPTDEEWDLLVSYQDYILETWGYYEGYLNKIKERPFYYDEGRNTTILGKVENRGWMYRKSTWQTGPAPYLNSDVKYETLLELLDHIETYSTKWDEWKVTHNI